MIALHLHHYGEPLDVLVLEDVAVPEPPAGQIRVRVAAVGLNPADWEICRGFMATTLPRGVGYDVAGTVDAVGAGVEDVAPGDLVLGTADFLHQPSAGAAELAVLDAWHPVPDGLGVVDAAVLPMVVQTAVWSLEALGSGPGDTLLVHGGGAMVGFAAVQVALARGARVVATAGPAFTPDLEALGAAVTPYGDGMAARVRELAGGPVDLVLDAAPPRPGTIAQLVEAAGDPARVMTISNHDEARAAGARVNLDELTAARTPVLELLASYADLAARGAFRLPVARTFPLTDWRDAVALSQSGHPRGKVVLLPAQGS